MPTVHSHYENLKVARNAPSEVIRAAYRTLSQKYHPDRNPEDPEAARIMTVINAAYETLSDPTKRRQHDEWIARMEANETVSTGRPGRAFEIDESKLRPKAVHPVILVARHLGRWWFAYLVLVGIVFASLDEKKPQRRTETARQVSPPVVQPQTPRAPPRPAYVRPQYADNGALWPTKSGYVKGYRRQNADGYSTLTVDNTQNASDVFVKIYSLAGVPPKSVRAVFIRANDSFTLKKLRPGLYDVRYRDLDSGALSRSDPFSIEEHRTETGVQYTDLTVTLYKVRGGKLKMHDIPDTEFEEPLLTEDGKRVTF
jgi:curved DNA-binding protein CbpA